MRPAIAFVVLLVLLPFQRAAAQPRAEGAFVDEGRSGTVDAAVVLSRKQEALPRITGPVACEHGKVGAYPCRNVDLLSFVPILQLGADSSGNLADIWGWTDPETRTEYALIARTDGTAFVDLGDPTNPVLVGSLPTRADTTTWRDVKVVNGHAVIVADNAGDHGMQVFDLSRLREVAHPPVEFEATAVYEGFGSAHNLVVNEESDHVYAVGISSGQSAPAGSGCGPGLHIVDMSDPAHPEFAGCFNPNHGRGYTHDAQCIRYDGPDGDHAGHDVCFGADEVGVSITDVSDPSSPAEISLLSYPTSAYTHQGWLTEDRRYFIVNDELDELNGLTDRTRTLIFDVRNLDEPVYVGAYLGETSAVDHNLYIRNGLVFQSNYTVGLRILDLKMGADEELMPDAIEEIGYFDVFPLHDDPGFVGSWSSYPYFDSGVVIVSGIESGLYVLSPSALQHLDDEEPPRAIGTPSLHVYPNPASSAVQIDLVTGDGGPVRVYVFDPLGRRVKTVHDGRLGAGSHTFGFGIDGMPNGVYYVRVFGSGFSETVAVTVHR